MIYYFDNKILYLYLGPPQLSTMLSVTDTLDSPFEITNDINEETSDKSIRNRSQILNIRQRTSSENKLFL